MKTKYNIGQMVWVMLDDKPRRSEITRIVITKKSISYDLKFSEWEHFYEKEIAATKEELKELVFG